MPVVIQGTADRVKIASSNDLPSRLTYKQNTE